MEDRSMYATAAGTAAYPIPTPIMDRPKDAVPYCFILDEAYHVIMAGPTTGADPLASLYEAESEIDALPGPIDRVVRAMTASWRSSRPANASTASVNELQVTIAPLHGFDGRRIAVFIQRSDAAYQSA
jgi:hypothetical protein